MSGASYSVESDPSEGSFEENRERMDVRREIELDVQRKDIGVQVNMDEESVDDTQNKDARISSSGEVDPSIWSTAAKRGKKKVRGLKGSKKREFWNKLKSGLGSSSNRDSFRCERCGRLHKGVCLAGTTACFRCGQEGHVVRECRTAPWIAQSQRTFLSRVVQQEAATSDPVVPGTEQRNQREQQ
ncbi:uncharacterized protein LOC122723746 [Manihot esculenta]|uniref:uncharacterized protein LOC122723746 n=1 Tax=Manihot esculenta TaxID=3983 RepID=UPI001CC48BC3|nr:uncharacterized protein LOC122723746 [Manihot esculenta]